MDRQRHVKTLPVHCMVSKSSCHLVCMSCSQMCHKPTGSLVEFYHHPFDAHDNAT